MPTPIVNREHRRVLDGPSANARVEEALARTSAGEAIADLRMRLEVLTAGDIDLLAKVSGPQWRDGVGRVTKIRLDPRFVKAGYGRLVLRPLRRIGASSPLDVAELLLLPALSPRAERVLGERFDNPSPEDVAELVQALLGEFPARIVACYLASAIAGEAPGAAAIAEVLAGDERLSPPGG